MEYLLVQFISPIYYQQFMKLYFVCFFTLFVFFINTQIHEAYCPPVCNCIDSAISDQCFICLEKQFKRNYRIENNTCPCIQNYVQNYPPTDYCCAKNCLLCYWQGCYECRKNWTKTLNGAYYVCSCKDNYYYDWDLDDCICLNNYQDQLQYYYSPTRFQCYRCPYGCSCNASGCYQCNQQSHRIVNYSLYNYHACYCLPNYTEIKGQCIFTEDIQKPDCSVPLIQSQNGSCLCIQPYYQDEQNNCICKSILDPTYYYLYLGICYRCPYMCKCNKYGCVYCSVIANRIIQQNHCTCVKDTGIFQLNGQCICISPYNKTCYCNNFTQPSLFTNLNNQCKKCPKGCQCDKTGCFWCDQTSRRNDSCVCQWPFLQLDGLCINCPQNYMYINNSCICATIYSWTLFYQDNINIKCNYCPPGCICEEDGCNSCNNTNPNRVIKSNYNPDSTRQHFNTCYCDTANHFRQNSSYYCQCIPPYVFNQTTENCTCQDPYYINIQNECVCNSQKDQLKFYSYNDTDCRPCPLECNCSAIGCYACSTKTGRIILMDSSSNYICPCFPITRQTNKSLCIICNQNQYLWSNQCVDCDSNCKTCNENGCLSCQQSMTLSDNTCICTGNLYYNGQSCACPESHYLNLNFQTCVACPVNCVNCQYNYQIQNTVKCIECNITAFRKNNISQQCPCIDYYVEAPLAKAYCCHRNCKDCNMSGCISCLPFSYRQLNYTDPKNVTCSCMNGFVQGHHIVCSCPTQTYRYFEKCQPCQSYCLKCHVVLQIISCITCVNGLNRIKQINQQKSSKNINSTIHDCVCIGGYQQYTNQSHCYPKSCLVISENGLCAICGPNRIKTRNVSYCNCTTGFYEDQAYRCKACSNGCVKCISYDVCKQCDSDKDYYLVFNKKYMVINCIKPDYSVKIFYQQYENLILEIKGINNTNSTNITSTPSKTSPKQYLSTKNLSIYLILLTQNVSISTIKLNVLQSKITNTDILFIKFNNLTKDQLKPFLLYINSTNQSGFLYQRYYLMKDEAYSKYRISYSSVQEIFIYLMISCIIIISYILNILGQKHNQLIYYCQTIYFIAMNVKDTHMYLVPFLNYFRITTFNFTFYDSGSPFNSLISDWVLYFQKTYGNYRYFSVDNNLIRNVGLALYLAIQNLFLQILFRIIYTILFRSKHKVFAQKYKKLVYRSLQWMRKVTMYPLLFFSLSTLILYQKQYSLIDQSFRQLNKNIAISILVVYLAITFLQILLEQISKIYKYELLLEYLFDITNSVIIIYSFYNQYILFALIPSMLLKCILQYVKYRVFMYKPSTIYNYINILYLLECLIIIPIYLCNLAGTLTLILLYILGTIVLRIYLIKKKYNLSKFEKKIINVVDVPYYTQQKIVATQYQKQSKIQLGKQKQ